MMHIMTRKQKSDPQRNLGKAFTLFDSIFEIVDAKNKMICDVRNR